MARSAGLVRLTAIGLVLAFGAVAHAENASNKLSANKLSVNKLSSYCQMLVTGGIKRRLEPLL
jgi:hypothetical protein